MTEMKSWLFVMYFPKKILMHNAVRLVDPSLCLKQLTRREFNEIWLYMRSYLSSLHGTNIRLITAYSTPMYTNIHDDLVW